MLSCLQIQMQLLLHLQVARLAPVGKQCILKRAELLNVSAHCSHGIVFKPYLETMKMKLL